MSTGEGSDAGIGQLARLASGIGTLVALVGTVALVADFISGVNALLLGILFEAVAANTVDVPDWAYPGVDTQKLPLETGIVLLGARTAIDEFVASGPVFVRLVVVTVVAGVLLVETVAGRVFGLTDKAGSLLTVGASACGVSAATAIADTVDADGESLTHVVVTVLLFDAFTLAAFPIAGDLLLLSSRQFGIWAGLSMFSTDPVTAVGFTHFEVAGRWATVTKLARNSMLDFIAVTYAIRYAGCAKEAVTSLRAIFDGVPRFLVDLVAVAAVANLGLLSDATLVTVGITNDALFALAFAGLGLGIRLDAIRWAGAAPLTVLGVQLLTVSALTLAAILALF